MPLMRIAEISLSHRKVSEFQSWEKPFNACLNSDEIPVPGPECDYCAYVRAIGELDVGSHPVLAW